MKLTPEQMQILLDFANDLEAQIRFNYSGRGMYGKECVGFITNMSVAVFCMKLAIILCQNHNQSILAVDLANNVKTDNMGKDTIVYFPGITA